MLRGFVSTLVSLAMVINPLAAQSQAEDNPIIQHFEAEANRLNAIPAWQTDLAALAAELPRNVETVRDWVQTETRFVPYAGLLKGAEGVFWEREGNSLDRALLLGELLKTKGETVRIGRYNTGSAAREKLLANMTATTRRHNEVSIPTATSQLTPTDLGLSDENWEQTASAIQEAAQALPELQDAMFGALTRVVQPKLRALRSNTPAQAKSANHDQAMASLLDYWVAEIQIDGEWQRLILDDFGDVDPELEWSFSYDLDEVPELYHHSVVFEVRAVFNDGTELELVSHNGSASAYEGDTVNIYMAPIRQGGATQRAALVAELKEGRIPDDIEKILEGALEGEVPDYGDVRHWLPVISTNQGIVQTLGVDIGGTTVPSEDIEASAENGAALGTVGLAAVVIDVVTLFDKEVQTRERRELLSYDTDGEFKTVAIHSAYEVQTRRYTPEELEYRALQGISELANAPKSVESQHTNPPCLPCQAYGLVRWEIGEDYSDTFLSRPNIAGSKQYHIADASGQVTSMHVFDIVQNTVDVYTGQTVQSFDPFTVRVEQGLRDSIAETVIASMGARQVFSAANSALEQGAALNETRDLQDIVNFFPRTLSSSINSTSLDKTGFLLSERTSDDLSQSLWRIDRESGSVLSFGQTGDGFAAAAFGVSVIILAGLIVSGGYLLGQLLKNGEITGKDLFMAAVMGASASAVTALFLVGGSGSLVAITAMTGDAAFGIIAKAALGAFVIGPFRTSMSILWDVIAERYEFGDGALQDPEAQTNDVEANDPAPMCVDLSSVVPSGSAGSIGIDGSVCGLSCGQIKGFYEQTLRIQAWDLVQFYEEGLANCCTGGSPICR